MVVVRFVIIITQCDLDLSLTSNFAKLPKG